MIKVQRLVVGLSLVLGLSGCPLHSTCFVQEAKAPNMLSVPLTNQVIQKDQVAKVVEQGLVVLQD